MFETDKFVKLGHAPTESKRHNFKLRNIWFYFEINFLSNTQFTYRSFFNKVPYSKTEFQYRNIQSNSLKTLDLEKTSILKIDKSPRISFWIQLTKYS